MRKYFRRLSFELRRMRPLGKLLMALGAVMVAAAVLLTSRLTPTVVELALAAATDDITIAVNETVTQVLAENGVEYGSLVTLERDGQGNVTALISNTPGINLLKARITNAVVERFADSDITGVRIPLGNIIGGALLSGRGPRIDLDILSVTNVTTALRHEFSSAGINQTRHQILLDVEVTLDVLLGGSAGTDKVVTEVSVAETVIVGSVPDAYAQLSPSSTSS